MQLSRPPNTLPLIVGAFLMLVLAAFIEAFWSPRDIANEIKYSVGSACWAFVLIGIGDAL